MFNGKYILLIYTVALQVHCSYTVALQEYYAHWLGVVKQRGIPKKQSFYNELGLVLWLVLDASNK